MKVVTLEKIRVFCRDRYYACDGVLWEPFNAMTHEVIGDRIDRDVYDLCLFLGVDYEKEGV